MTQGKRLFVYEYVSGGGALPAAEAAELLPLGLAMRDAMAADVRALAGWTATVAGADVQPRPDEAAVDFVVRQAALHDAAWIVAPETGGLLAQLARAVGPQRWVGCAADAIALCSSKPATLAALNARGVPTPLDFAVGARRWVVKPADGAGCVATRLHEGLSAPIASEGFTVEPWVDGEALSASLLNGELLAINRQRIGLQPDGALSFDGLQLNVLAPAGEHGRAIAALARDVAAAIPGLAGFYGLDLVWHATRGPVLIEVNPRVTVAYAGLSAALGRNLAGEVLQAWR